MPDSWLKNATIMANKIGTRSAELQNFPAAAFGVDAIAIVPAAAAILSSEASGLDQL